MNYSPDNSPWTLHGNNLCSFAIFKHKALDRKSRPIHWLPFKLSAPISPTPEKKMLWIAGCQYNPTITWDLCSMISLTLCEILLWEYYSKYQVHVVEPGHILWKKESVQSICVPGINLNAFWLENWIKRQQGKTHITSFWTDYHQEGGKILMKISRA